MRNHNNIPCFQLPVNDNMLPFQDERNELRARERVLQTERELHERESRRFQHLYESEVRLREALASRLERVSENVHNVSRL